MSSAAHDSAAPGLLAEISARLRGPEFADWRTPDLDRLEREYRRAVLDLPLAQRLDLALQLYASGYIPEAHIANCVLERSIRELGPQHADLLDHAAGLLTEWGTTDEFCIDIVQPFLARYPAETLALVRQWNGSDHIWKRRASVVTFTRKVGEGGHCTHTALALCERLLDDPHDLIRKAVGWALKDNLRGSHDIVLDYVKDLRRRGVSAVITLYAIRDLHGPERESVLAIRPERP